MTRTYAREEVRWDIDALHALAALQPPQATYFEAADRWVVKQDGRSFAVKPDQIVSAADDNAAEAALADADNVELTRAQALVEEVFTLRHGIAENRDGEFDDEERALVEQILQDESGEVTVALREEIAEAQYQDQAARTGVYVPAPAPARTQHWGFGAEADALLARFTR